MAYQQPQQLIYQQIVKPPSNGMAVTSLILGILAIVVGVWTPIPIAGLVFAFLSFLPALLAIIFGHVGLSTSKTNGVGKGQAITGLILGYLTIGIIVVVTMIWILTPFMRGFEQGIAQ